MASTDPVTRDAAADHRHNPPGHATRPIGRRTTGDIIADAAADDELGGHMAELDRTWTGQHLALVDEEYRHDASFGAFDERPGAA